MKQKKKRTQYDDIIVPPLKKYFVLSETKEEHVYIYKRKEIRHCFDSPFDMIKLHTFTFWKKREPQGFFVGEQNGSPYISGHFFFKNSCYKVHHHRTRLCSRKKKKIKVTRSSKQGISILTGKKKKKCNHQTKTIA